MKGELNMDNNSGPAASRPVKQRRIRFGSGWANAFFLIFGIILPTAALAVEITTRLCRAYLFDPLPTWAHGILVALVPLGNFLIWNLHRRNRCASARLGMLNGAGLIIAAYYTLLFLPIIPIASFGLVAVFYFGIGLVALLPMAPAFGLLAALTLRKRLRSITGAAPGQLTPGLTIGLLAGLAALLLVAGPGHMHTLAMRLALSKAPDTSARGIQWLRHGNSEPMLRRYCHWDFGRPADLFTLLTLSRMHPSTEQCRTIYYRVTGAMWNSMPPPEDSFLMNRINPRTVWDPNVGGDTVGAVLPGLTLTDSRMDAVVDAPSATAYTEWTWNFQNDTALPREARALVTLPPGGVVSRLTLWIHDEPREAAFGGRSQTRQAYQEVAVVQRRDPVLVTTHGPDTVLVQCFPIPADGTMKIRLGITSPMRVNDPNAATLSLPAIQDRNFQLAKNLNHTLWVEANAPIRCGEASLIEEQVAEQSFTLRGILPAAPPSSSTPRLSVDRTGAPQTVWVNDPQQPAARIIQRLKPTAFPKPDRIILVIDGSASMNSNADGIRELLQHPLPTNVTDILVASDTQPLHIRREQLGTRNPSAVRFEGGMDNLSALTQAWDLLHGDSSAWIVWLHGPIPMLLGSPEGLQQRYERRKPGPLLVSVPVAAGPDRIMEKLEAAAPTVCVPPDDSFPSSVARLLAGEAAWLSACQPERTVEPASNPLPIDAVNARPYLVDLWAYDQILNRLPNLELRNELIDMAIRYHLVTPVSGAVVLENDRQYEQAGLKPNEANHGHIVPEPSAVLLLFTGAAILLIRKALRKS